jgi:hypothetical protein
MKKTKFLKLVTLAGALVLGTLRLQAQTTSDSWETIADIQVIEGLGAGGRALGTVTDRSGKNVRFSAGYAFMEDVWEDSSVQAHGAILRQEPGGDWQVVDLTQRSGSSQGNGWHGYWAFAADPSVPQSPLDASPLYAGGLFGDSMLIRKSSDGGDTWDNAGDPYRHDSTTITVCRALAVDGAGTIYAGAQSHASQTWLIRKSSDGGDTWHTMDVRKGSPRALCYRPQETPRILVAGEGEHPALKGKGNTYSYWLVRESADEGVTWRTIDDFKPSGAGRGLATALHVDPSGIVYATGWFEISEAKRTSIKLFVRKGTFSSSAETWNWTTLGSFPGYGWAVNTDLSGAVYVAGGVATGNQWTVRKLSAGSTAWELSDSFSAGREGPYALATDADGNVLSTGFAVKPEGRAHWVIRELASPNVE